MTRGPTVSSINSVAYNTGRHLATIQLGLCQIQKTLYNTGEPAPQDKT